MLEIDRKRDVETAAVRPAQAVHVRDALGEQSRDQVHRLAATGHRTVALAGLATEPLDRLVPAQHALLDSRHARPVLALRRIAGHRTEGRRGARREGRVGVGRRAASSGVGVRGRLQHVHGRRHAAHAALVPQYLRLRSFDVELLIVPVQAAACPALLSRPTHQAAVAPILRCAAHLQRADVAPHLTSCRSGLGRLEPPARGVALAPGGDRGEAEKKEKEHSETDAQTRNNFTACGRGTRGGGELYESNVHPIEIDR
eukprot:scaffold613_cov79-Phaeocystis_antarctica.AAC.5